MMKSLTIITNGSHLLSDIALIQELEKHGCKVDEIIVTNRVLIVDKDIQIETIGKPEKLKTHLNETAFIDNEHESNRT